MKTLSKFLLAGAASVLVAGAANAQTTLTITNTGTASGEIGFDGTSAADPQVVLSSGAAAPQVGTLVFTIAPVDGGSPSANFGASATQTGFVTITLDNATFTTTLSAANVASTGDCAAVASAATVESGGVFGTSEVEFEISSLGDCDGVGGTPGILEFSIPLVLSTIGTTNFDVAVAGVTGAILVGPQDYDAGLTAEADPLIITDEPFAVSVAADTTLAELALAADPSFTAFVGGATSDVVATVNVTDNETTSAITDTSAATAQAEFLIEVTVPDATGIDSFTFDIGTAGTDLELGNSILSPGEFEEDTTAVQAGTVSTPVDLDLTINLAGDEPVEEQVLTIDVAIAAADGGVDSAQTTVSLDREGSDSTEFEWVALNTANIENLFIFSGIEAATSADVPDIFVNIADLNIGGVVEAGNSGGVIDDFNLTEALGAAAVFAAINGGEFTISSEAIGDALTAASFGNFIGDEGVVRGTVTFTIEQAGVEVRRLYISGIDEAVTVFTGDFAVGTDDIN